MKTPELIAILTIILPFLPCVLAPLPPPARLALMAAWKIVPFLFHHLPLMLHVAQSVVHGFAFWTLHCGGHVPEEVYLASCVLYGILALLHRRPPGADRQNQPAPLRQHRAAADPPVEPGDDG